MTAPDSRLVLGAYLKAEFGCYKKCYIFTTKSLNYFHDDILDRGLSLTAWALIRWARSGTWLREVRVVGSGG